MSFLDRIIPARKRARLAEAKAAEQAAYDRWRREQIQRTPMAEKWSVKVEDKVKLVPPFVEAPAPVVVSSTAASRWSTAETVKTNKVRRGIAIRSPFRLARELNGKVYGVQFNINAVREWGEATRFAGNLLRNGYLRHQTFQALRSDRQRRYDSALFM